MLGLVDIALICFVYFTNLYKIKKEAGILDLYCDNMQMHFFITLIFAILYIFVIVADEYQNKTIYQLAVIPIKAGKFIMAKVIIVLCFNLMVMFFSTVISMGVMMGLHYQIKIEEVVILFVINFFDSILLTLVMVPIICLTILCNGKYMTSILVNAVYIISCFMINMIPISQEISQKVIAYFHPLGGYALIHNWLIYALIPNEISMIIRPEENAGLAFGGICVYVLMGFILSERLLERNKGR